jgi:NAD(P)-dependent dehydrogenase (short-subunit alcohol dehydrogenase family)
MSAIDASQLLRPGVLEGISMVLAGPDEGASFVRAGSVGDALGAACRSLGARVWECPLVPDASPELEQARVEQTVGGLLETAGNVDLVAVDGASLFGLTLSGEPDSPRAALRRCLDASWNVTRAIAQRAFLPDGRGGRVVYIAPAPDAGEHADAARAGLENLARTLSIEWARFGVTVVTIALGSASGDASAASEAAVLTAYLASPAGAYFSGCLLDLRGPSSP